MSPDRTTTPRTTLADQLAHADSGTTFVYDCLARLVDDLDLEHAIAVIECEGAIHVFNRGRLPLSVGWERHIALARVTGFHTVPERPEHRDLLDEAHHLCTVAFRLAPSRRGDLESSLRAITGIVAVGQDTTPSAMTVQVLVDASRAPARVRELVRKQARAASDRALVLEVIVHEPARLRYAPVSE